MRFTPPSSIIRITHRFHPENPYIARNDAPKVEHLREQFPDIYKKYGSKA